MIEIINLNKSFGRQKVLNDLNLDINKGETTVIIGRSGVGKSVLLKHIIGIMSPDTGQVLVDGIDVTRLRGKQVDLFRLKFGMLFQGAALFDSLSVGENVGFSFLEHTKLSKKEIAKHVREALELVGLRGIEDLKPAELSGGMKKRVGLARAICRRPEIVLYDEPTTGVDPVMADAVNELIKELHDRLNVTSICVTHDMTSAYKIAHKIAMLYEGKIIALGTPSEIKNSKNPIVKQFVTGSAIGPITDNKPSHTLT